MSWLQCTSSQPSFRAKGYFVGLGVGEWGGREARKLTVGENLDRRNESYVMDIYRGEEVVLGFLEYS